MLKIRVQNQFKKDVKRAKKRGNNVELLKEVIQRLAKGETLELRFRDHS